MRAILIVLLYILCFYNVAEAGLNKFVLMMSAGSSIASVEECISNGSFTDDDFTSLSGWSQFDNGDGVITQSGTLVNLDSGSPASIGDYAYIQQNTTPYGDNVVLSFKFNITKTGDSVSNNVRAYVHTENSTGIDMYFRTNGLFMNDNSATIVEVGTDVNLVCSGSIATGCEQYWSFNCTGLSGIAPTCDIYRYVSDTDSDWVLIAENQEANVIGSPWAAPGVFFDVRGYSSSNIEVDVDWVKVGNGCQ